MKYRVLFIILVSKTIFYLDSTILIMFIKICLHKYLQSNDNLHKK